MSFSSFYPPQRTLMGPGPSDISPRVLSALAKPTIGHLDPQFVEMMDQVKTMLQQAFFTENAATLAISAPGSAGMEACFVNLIEPDDTVIVCINGVFGTRMAENVKRIGANLITIETPWGQAVDPELLEQCLRQNPKANTVAFVHAETSTGALSDAKTLCDLAKKYGCLTIVDAVTSLAGNELRVDEWQIDAIYSGSQKCLSCVPGLSPVSFSERAVSVMTKRQRPVQSWFLDQSLVMGYWAGSGKRSYHHTAPVNSLYALHESLVLLHSEGIEASWQRHQTQHNVLAAGLKKLGLEFVVEENVRLPQLNAVYIPEHIDDAKARRYLLEQYNLEIGAGLGSFAGKTWRIGLMGYTARAENVALCLAALEDVLNQ